MFSHLSKIFEASEGLIRGIRGFGRTGFAAFLPAIVSASCAE
jgi:hypothetical protein